MHSSHQSQARAHHNLSAALLEPSAASNRNSTSSLQHTLQSLRVASNGRGEATRALAVELEEHVLVPFNGWRQRHEDRIEAAREALLSRGGIVSDWEKEVNRLMGVSTARKSDTLVSERYALFRPSVILADLLAPSDISC